MQFVSILRHTVTEAIFSDWHDWHRSSWLCLQSVFQVISVLVRALAVLLEILPIHVRVLSTLYLGIPPTRIFCDPIRNLRINYLHVFELFWELRAEKTPSNAEFQSGLTQLKFS